MRTTFIAIALLSLLDAVVRAELVEMTTGPDLSVRYDSAAWTPLAPLRKPEPGTFQSMTWKHRKTERVQISVASHPNRKNDDAHKQEILFTQKLRGEPAEFVRARRESLADRDWQVLEFRNPSTRRSQSEIHHFLSTDAGHITLFVTGEEAILPTYREAIEMFIREIRVK